MVVKGVATTMMATLDVVERAAAAGRNMVITHEPTFYSHLDTTDTLQQDATYKFKADFLRSHDMAVSGFTTTGTPDGPTGSRPGWPADWIREKIADAPESTPVHVPRYTAPELFKAIESRLGIGTMRVIGDPSLRSGTWWRAGAMTSPSPGMPTFARPDVDVLVIGETRKSGAGGDHPGLHHVGDKKALVSSATSCRRQGGMRLRRMAEGVPERGPGRLRCGGGAILASRSAGGLTLAVADGPRGEAADHVPSRRRSSSSRWSPRSSDMLPTGSEWLYEVKLDGYRALLKHGSDIRLESRNNKDLTRAYPEVRSAAAPVTRRACCSMARSSRSTAPDVPSFQALQHRSAHPRHASSITPSTCCT